MSACSKCGHNILPGESRTCELAHTQVHTKHGVVSKIMGCPDFTSDTRLDFQPRNQAGTIDYRW